MAEQGRWAKIWVQGLRDPDLDNLSIEDFGRWVKVLILTKEQGTKGTLKITEPARTICSMLQVQDFDELIICVKKFPHCNTDIVTIADRYIELTFRNWHKYQVDNSVERVRKHRADVTTKKRREEEEKRSKEVGQNVTTKSADNRRSSGKFNDQTGQYELNEISHGG